MKTRNDKPVPYDPPAKSTYMMKPGRPDTKHVKWAGCEVTLGLKGEPCVPYKLDPTDKVFCCCTYNDYQDDLFKDVDCPEHGESTRIERQRQAPQWIPSKAPHLVPPDNVPTFKMEDVFPASSIESAPAHYRNASGLQPWQVIQAFGLDYWEGNAIKYLLRAGKKGAYLEDLKKARHYIDYLIEREQ